MDIKNAAKALGKKGGEATMKKHGKEHYKKLAQHMNEVRYGKKAPKLPLDNS